MSGFKSILSVLLFILISFNLFSNDDLASFSEAYELLPQEPQWSVKYTYFLPESVVDRSDNDLSGGEIINQRPFSEFGAVDRREFSGQIVIRETDPINLGTRTHTIRNVRMSLVSVGPMIIASSLRNKKIYIHGLDGKSISSIFEGTYRGIRAGAVIGIGIAINPNFSGLSNGELYLDNINNLIDSSEHGYFGIGGEVVYQEARFFFRSEEAGNISISYSYQTDDRGTVTSPIVEINDPVTRNSVLSQIVGE